MGFFFLLLYVAVSYVRPADLFPELLPYRIPLCLAIAGLLCSAPRLITLGFPYQAWQIYLMFGFLGAVMMSQLFQGWLGGAVAAFTEMLTACLAWMLTLLTVDSLKRVCIMVALLCLLLGMLIVPGAVACHSGSNESPFVMKQQLEETERGGERSGLMRIRGLGYLNDPNDFAQALVMAIPFVFLGWRKSQRIRNLVVVIIPIAFFLYGIFLTHSRGSMVALLVIFVVALEERLRRFRRLVPTVAAVMLVIVLSAANFSGGRSISSADESAEGRLAAWSVGLTLLRQFPLFGAGFGNFTEHNELTAHNSFVLCFSELGLVGYFFWLGMVMVTALELRNIAAANCNEASDEDLRRWAQATKLSLYGFLVAAFFLSRTYSPTLYLLLGIAIALIGIARRAGLSTSIGRPLRVLLSVGVVELGSVGGVYILVRLQRLLGR